MLKKTLPTTKSERIQPRDVQIRPQRGADPASASFDSTSKGTWRKSMGKMVKEAE
jgi:hypothetical protein